MALLGQTALHKASMGGSLADVRFSDAPVDVTQQEPGLHPPRECEEA